MVMYVETFFCFLYSLLPVLGLANIHYECLLILLSLILVKNSCSVVFMLRLIYFFFPSEWFVACMGQSVAILPIIEVDLPKIKMLGLEILALIFNNTSLSMYLMVILTINLEIEGSGHWYLHCDGQNSCTLDTQTSHILGFTHIYKWSFIKTS